MFGITRSSTSCSLKNEPDSVHLLLPPSPNLSPILLPIPHPPRSPISSLLILVVIIIPSSFSGRVLEHGSHLRQPNELARLSSPSILPLFLPCLPYAERTPLMASLPSSLHSPSGRGGEAARREGGRSDLRKKEQKRLAHTHKSETCLREWICHERHGMRCYAFLKPKVAVHWALSIMSAPRLFNS